MDNISAERLLDENKRRSVPGLHPGLNDLIRVLGKQAHCASRTLILCEPHIPSKTKRTNYHKHCSPKRRNSSDTVVRSAALWSPVRPEQYYYDCFSYSHYPDRETDYKDIENKYKALKDKPLRYSPPVCDKGRIRRSLESPGLRHRKRTEHMVESHPHATKTHAVELEVSSSQITSKLLTSSEAINQNVPSKIVKVSSSQQQSLKRPPLQPESKVSKITKGAVESESNSVPCAELIDLRNLIRKSDRENFERMQQMLLLMKELSAKDFCRATCDKVGERYDEMGYGKWNERGGVTPSGEPVDEKYKASVSKSMKTSQPSSDSNDECESSDSEKPGRQSPEDLTDTSTTSVESSSGHSKNLSSLKSKSSTKVVESGSEASLEQDRIPFLQGDKQETSSESEERPTESESSASSFDKLEVGQASSGSVKKPDVAQIASARSDVSQKMQVAGSTDSLKDHAQIASARSDLSQKMQVAGSTDSLKDHAQIASARSDLSQKMQVAGSTDSLKGQRSFARNSDSVRDTKKQADTRSIDGRNDESDRSPKRFPSDHDNGNKNLLLTVCDSPMTVHELVEVSNIITDIVVLETVNELIKNGMYSLPSKRQDGASRTGSPSMVSEGTRESPFEVRKGGGLKSLISDSNLKERSIAKDLKSVSLPRASTIESYRSSKGLPDVTSLEESVSSKIKRKSVVQPTSSRTVSGISRGEPMTSKTNEGSNVDSIKLKVDEGSLRSKRSDESREEPMKSKQGEGSLRSKMIGGSRAESVKSKPEGELGFESMKSELGGGYRTESMKPEVGSLKSGMSEDFKAESMKSRTSRAGSMRSGISKESTGGSQKYKGIEDSRTDSFKPRLSEELKIESVRSKRSEESTTGTAQSNNSMKLKSIEERTESSKVSRKSEQSEPEARAGNEARAGDRRASSCPKHSRSPSPSDDGGSMKRDGELSYASQGTSDRDRIKGLASSSSVKSQKERRGRLSGEVTKLSTIDSVCEREDSQMCVDYETDRTILYYVRITENAYPPEKESYNAAGFMLKSAYDYTIPPRGKVSVKTDLVLELPINSYGRIAARKCLAVNFGVDVGADVIDRDCRENVTVLLFNHSDKPFSVRKGNKVAQLICESIHQPAAKEKCDLLNST